MALPIRWKLDYPTLGDFIQRHAPYVSSGALFFRTRTPYAVGTEVEFQLLLADETEVLSGSGVVSEVRLPNPAKPAVVPGMAVKFSELSPASQEMLLMMLAHKAAVKADKEQKALLAAQQGQQAPPVLPGAASVQQPEKQSETTAANPVPLRVPAPSVPLYSSPSLGAASATGGGVGGMTAASTPFGPPSVPLAVAAPPSSNPPPGSFSPTSSGVTPTGQRARPVTPTGVGGGMQRPQSKTQPGAVPEITAGRAEYPAPQRFSRAVQMHPESVGRIPAGDKPLNAPSGPIIGIDSGTTNSCASVVEGGRPIVIPSRRGYSTIPSMVAINEVGKLVVGHMARSQFLLNPANTVYGAKRLIGRKYRSPLVQGLKSYFNYEIVEAQDGSTAVRLGGQVLTMPQVSALILLEIKEIAEEYLGCEVNRAVITVPAYYNDNQRNAVREAGRLAGFHVERIVNEPTAAALAYGFGKGLSQRVLVYDLGGGTFDASVLQLEGDVYEVISTGGNNFLGGIDFDNRLADHFDEIFRLTHGVGLPQDIVSSQRVKFAAEQAKIALSEQPEYQVHVPYIMMNEDKPLDLALSVTRNKLNELTDDLISRTLAVCDQVLQAKNIDSPSVDSILLVGGQSRDPEIRARLNAHFQRPIGKGVHPDESVALGAAILAQSLQKAAAGVLLIDVLPISIGLALPNGGYARIIPKNTKLPAEKRFTIATTRDYQSEMSLVVLQGEKDRFAENDYLGTLRFDGLTPAPAGQNVLQVRFSISNESTLVVTALDGISGREIRASMSMRDLPDAYTGAHAMPVAGSPPACAASDAYSLSGVDEPSSVSSIPGPMPGAGRHQSEKVPALGDGLDSTMPGPAPTPAAMNPDELAPPTPVAPPRPGSSSLPSPEQDPYADLRRISSPNMGPLPETPDSPMEDDDKPKTGFWDKIVGFFKRG